MRLSGFLLLIRSSKDQFFGEAKIENKIDECERWKKYNKIVEETVPGGGGSPCNGLYGKAPVERGAFVWLQVYERMGIFPFEVYERVGKSVIRVCERAQRTEQMNFMAL